MQSMPTQDLALHRRYLRLRSYGPAARRKPNAVRAGVLEHEPTFTIHKIRAFAGGLEPKLFKPFAEAWREIGLPE